MGGVDLFFAPGPLQPTPKGEEMGGGQLEAQARVIGGNNRGRGEGSETLPRSPPNKRQRDKGQGTWSFTESRSLFNGMVIRTGGPGPGKGGGQGEVQPEWR